MEKDRLVEIGDAFIVNSIARAHVGGTAVHPQTIELAKAAYEDNPDKFMEMMTAAVISETNLKRVVGGVEGQEPNEIVQ